MQASYLTFNFKRVKLIERINATTFLPLQHPHLKTSLALLLVQTPSLAVKCETWNETAKSFMIDKLNKQSNYFVFKYITISLAFKWTTTLKSFMIEKLNKQNNYFVINISPGNKCARKPYSKRGLYLKTLGAQCLFQEFL